MMKAWRTTHPEEFQRTMGLESLTLEGFVVDAQPFMKIFDENKFKKLEFMGLNLDAGLAFKPEMMAGMMVVIPDEDKQPQIRKMTTFPRIGSAKLIALRGVKKNLERKQPAFRGVPAKKCRRYLEGEALTGRPTSAGQEGSE
jgi:hypothetical protein